MQPARPRAGAADEAAVDDERWMVMGRIGAPFGVQGWVRILTFSTDPETLLDFEQWWLRAVPRPIGPGRAAGKAGPDRVGSTAAWRQVRVLEAQIHGGGVIALIEGFADRDQAALARGSEVGLLRSDLPQPEANEFYWEDLIGLTAVGRDGQTLGVVSSLLEAGAHDVLVIDAAAAGTAANAAAAGAANPGAGPAQAGAPAKQGRGRGRTARPRQILVPFVERHVGAIDLQARTVIVDWEEPV
jgi:16S rRNA processing protein RimM